MTNPTDSGLGVPAPEGAGAADALAPGASAVVTRKGRGGMWHAIKDTRGAQRGMLWFGAAVVAFFVILAVFAPLIAPYGFNQTKSAAGSDFATLQAPSAAHWFGTTIGGQDVLSRVIFGSRTALLVVVIAVVLSIVIGVPLGLISGYIGGWIDRVLVLVTDALFSFPSLLLAIVVSIAISGGQSSQSAGILSAAISITVVYVPQYFRVVRNATISAREEPYVEAARALGAKPTDVMRRYLFGNVVQSVPILGTVNAADAILTLAGLGFLGFGIEPSSAAEWGYDLNKALPDVAAGVPWTSLFPGTAIVLLVLGVSLIGESLNDVLNPLLRARRMGKVDIPARAAADAGSSEAVREATAAPDVLAARAADREEDARE